MLTRKLKITKYTTLKKINKSKYNTQLVGKLYCLQLLSADYLFFKIESNGCGVFV